MRLCTSIVDDEGTAYVQQGDKDHVCVRGEGTETTCYAKRDHSCMTGTPRTRPWSEGSASQYNVSINKACLDVSINRTYT